MQYLNNINVALFLLVLFFNPLIGQAQNYEVFQAEQAFQNQEFQKATSITKRILERDSLNFEAHRLLGSSLLAQQKAKEALRVANTGLHYFPDASALQWIKAESLLWLGKANEALSIYKQLLNKDTTLPKEKIRHQMGLIHQSEGGKFYSQKKWDLAEKHLAEAKNYIPDSLSSYSNLALVYAQQKQWDKALKVVDEGRAEFPNNVALQQIRANLLLQNGEYEKTITEYEMLHAKDPSNLDIALPYAQLLMANGKKEKASAIYEQLLEGSPDERQIYESLITFYERRRRIDAKRKVLREMQQQFPDDVSLLKRIAQTYRFQKKWKRVRAVYDTVQTMEGTSAEASLAVADTYIQQDSLQQADKVYEQALETMPQNEELLRLRGELQKKMKQWEAAEKTFTTLLSVNTNSYAYARLAEVQLQLGKSESAFSNYKNAAAKKDVHPNTYLQLSRIYVETDSLDKAFELGEQALRISLAKVQELQESFARTLRGNQNLAKMKEAEQEGKAFTEMNELAEEVFYSVVTQFPQKKVFPLLQSLKTDYSQSGKLLFMISSYYRNHGKQQEGLSLLKESVQLAPNLGKAHASLGEYYRDSDNKIRAIQSYERARSASPEYVESYIQLIELYQQSGKLDQLCERWMAELRANPDNEVLKEYLIAALHKAERYKDAQKLVN